MNVSGSYQVKKWGSYHLARHFGGDFDHCKILRPLQSRKVLRQVQATRAFSLSCFSKFAGTLGSRLWLGIRKAHQYPTLLVMSIWADGPFPFFCLTVDPGLINPSHYFWGVFPPKVVDVLWHGVTMVRSKGKSPTAKWSSAMTTASRPMPMRVSRLDLLLRLCSLEAVSLTGSTRSADSTRLVEVATNVIGIDV